MWHSVFLLKYKLGHILPEGIQGGKAVRWLWGHGKVARGRVTGMTCSWTTPSFFLKKDELFLFHQRLSHRPLTPYLAGFLLVC